MPRIVPVYCFTRRECGDQTSDSDGYEDKRGLERVEGVIVCKERCDARTDGVVAGERETAGEKNRGGEGIEEDSEGG